MENGQHSRDNKNCSSSRGEGTSDSPVVIRQPRGVAGAGVLSQHQFRILLRQKSNPAVFDATQLLFNHN